MKDNPQPRPPLTESELSQLEVLAEQKHWPAFAACRDAVPRLLGEVRALRKALETCQHTANAEREEENAQLRTMVAAANDGVLTDVGLWNIMRVWAEECHRLKTENRRLQGT